MNHYGLDPAWYFSEPGLAQDATFQITKVELELLSDPDILLMIESGIRGRNVLSAGKKFTLLLGTDTNIC